MPVLFKQSETISKQIQTNIKHFRKNYKTNKKKTKRTHRSSVFKSAYRPIVLEFNGSTPIIVTQTE